MNGTAATILAAVPEQVLYDLRRLNVPVHLSGYSQLCIAISKFSDDITQPVCGELYPAVANTFGHMDWRAVEFSIRRSILAAWKHRDPEVWCQYFPRITKVPSNKVFIATLAQRIK